MDLEDFPDADTESNDDEVPSQTAQSFRDDKKRGEWMNQPLDEKFRDVMELLKDEWRWDETSGNPTAPIIEDWKKVALMTETLSGDRTSPTFLQMLARYGKEFSAVPEAARRAIVLYALNHRHVHVSPMSHDLMHEDPGRPIMNLAVFHDNDDFIDCVMECWSDKFPELIAETDSQGENCLHSIFLAIFKKDIGALKSKRIEARSSALMRGKKIIHRARPETIAAKDSQGNTPLHYALDYNQCWGQSEEYIDLLRMMLEKGDPHMKGGDKALNNRKESPILYFRRTRTDLVQESKKQKEGKKVEDSVKTSRNQALKSNGATRPATKAFGLKSSSSPLLWAMEVGEFGAELTRIKPPQDKNQETKSITDVLVEKGLEFDVETGTFKVDGYTRTLNVPLRQVVQKSPEGFGISRSSTSSDVGAQSPRDEAANRYASNRYASIARASAHEPTSVPPNTLTGSKEQKRKRKEGRVSSLVKPMIDLLTRHYIRTRSDLEARNLIFGLNVSETNLFFDASGHETAQDIIHSMNRMSHGGFNDTLSYVCIPTVLHKNAEPAHKSPPRPRQMNQGAALQRPAPEDPSPGRTALIGVFRQLYKLNVRHILCLEVDDRKEPSHSDEAIELALLGTSSTASNAALQREPISVETWDWRKLDISIDIIAIAAPTVVEINLYWSGNQAILRAWGCPRGIPQLKHLKTVNIFMTKGLETIERMKKMLQRFKAEILRDSDNDLTVNTHRSIPWSAEGMHSDREADDQASGRVQGGKQHNWINRMESFRSALRGIHDCLTKLGHAQPERVKVALIDDGIDLNRVDPFYSKAMDDEKLVDKDIVQVLGITYCPVVGRSQSPWTQSSRGHGTIMANMILRINPWASLYSMKLQDGQDNDGRRTIFAESAADSIRGAIGRNVDVISMSWSVRNKDASKAAPAEAAETAARSAAAATNASPTKMLGDAVEEAAAAQALMFCSATDDIQVGAMDFLPYQKARHHIFRIGAATAEGQRSPHAEDEGNIEYFFPGNQVADAWNPSSERRVRYHDGSSVSTALAAGLASLILYCAVVLRTYYGERDSAHNAKMHDLYAKRVRLLKNRDSMKQAFDNIESKVWPDKKFLPVWAVFDQATENIENTRDLGKKMQALESLVSQLCAKIE